MKDFAVSLIEAMKGKKTQEAAAAEAKAEKEEAAGSAAGGPITGLPGLDAGALQGPLKMGSATAQVLFRSKTAAVLAKTLAPQVRPVPKPAPAPKPAPTPKPVKGPSADDYDGSGLAGQKPTF
jgi:hypothetical protein